MSISAKATFALSLALLLTLPASGKRVKAKYGLAYDAAERAAMRRVLAQCGPSDFSIQC